MYKKITRFFCRHHAYRSKFWLYMKLTTFFILAAFLQVSAATFAQRVTLTQKRATLDQIFTAIHKQTGYDVLWSADKISNIPTRDVNFKDADFREVLDEVLEHLPLTYVVTDKTVLIKEREPSLLDRLKTALAIPVTVSAKVYDETGQPLPGVTIKVKGTTDGTNTDAKGAFSINVPDNNSVLVFSFVGFESQELAAKDIATGSVIVMKAVSTNLKEVVVNKGYYRTTQELNTGNVTRVSGEDINKQPVSDPIMALEGRVPGLYISQASGRPGDAESIRIRGQNSISSGNNPFYIVDGVPFTSVSLSQANNILNSPFNTLNPADIESIEILKDADATAIYGSRGANGVILITTKKGKVGKTQFDFDVKSGIGKVTRTIPMLNTQQYLTMRQEAFKNDGLTPGPGDYDVNGTWNTNSYTDWEKILIGGTSHFDNIQGSVSGGNSNTQFLINGNYSYQTPIFSNNWPDTKGGLHFNLNHASQDQKFHINLSGSYDVDANKALGQDFTQYINLPPDSPSIYNPDGSLNWANSTWYNPIAGFAVSSEQKYKNLNSRLVLSYDLLPGLSIKGSFGYNDLSESATTYIPITASDPAYAGSYSRSSSLYLYELQTLIVEPTLGYNKKIGNGKIDILLGGTYQQNEGQANLLSSFDFPSDALIYNAAAAASNIANTTLSQYHYTAAFGRISYSYDDKYVLNITGRRDGSSRFGPGRQFGNFGAIGAGWIFTKENFFNIPALNFGKLRMSYGITGNDQINDYQFLSLYSVNNNIYQGVSGLTPIQLNNPLFGWESVRKLEFGLELGLFNNRLQFNTSYYRNRSSNQLVGYPLPSITGFGSIQANLPALVQNTGVELDVHSTNIKSKDFSWASSFNLTIPRNKLLAYPNLALSSYANTYVVGKSLYIQKLYHFQNVDPQTGLYTFSTANSDGNPSYPNDLTSVKEISQKFYGGFQNTFSYKRFHLDIFFQFVKQTGYSYVATANYSMPGTMNNQPISVLNNWKTNGQVATIQQFSTGGTADSRYYAYRQSDAAIVDASFIRLKNLAFSYTIPAEKLGVRNAQIYIQAQNLFTITNYFGLDPETQNNYLPPIRMVSVGFNVGL